MSRQNYNIIILNQLRKSKFFESLMDEQMSGEVYDTLDDSILDYPHQRFGQIFTNYVYPDYRQRQDDVLNRVMDILFYGCTCDPFYEESKETYNRLVVTRNCDTNS